MDEAKANLDIIKQASIRAANDLSLYRPGMRELYEDLLKYAETYVGVKICQEIFLFMSPTSNEDPNPRGFDDVNGAKIAAKINMMAGVYNAIQNNLTEWLDKQDSGASKSKNRSSGSSMW